MYGAGGRALEILKKYPGRFESMHVKDEIKAAEKGEMDDDYESTILGKGILPVKEIVDLGENQVVRQNSLLSRNLTREKRLLIV